MNANPLGRRPERLLISAGARTDVGRRRSVNEDSLLAEFPVFLVADGMGGHEAGDRASAAVVEAFRPLVGREDLVPADVVRAIARAHELVHEISAGTDRGAGSTVTGVVVVQQDGTRRWLVFNLGDSRVYRLLGDELEQLTVDHSVAQELVDQGRLRREEMASYEGRNVITRAVGADQSDADYWLMPIVTGERILICSDGLTGEVADAALRAGLALSGATQQTADVLVDQAVRNGGRDNVSVVVLDVVSGGGDPDLDHETGSVFGEAAGLADELEATTRTAVGRRPRGR